MVKPESSSSSKHELRRCLSEPKLSLVNAAVRRRFKSPSRAHRRKVKTCATELSLRPISAGESIKPELDVKVSMGSPSPAISQIFPKTVAVCAPMMQDLPLNKNQSQEFVHHMLNFVRETIITCKFGRNLYRFGKYPGVTEKPRVSTTVKKPPCINPKHTELSWRRLVSSRLKRMEPEQCWTPPEPALIPRVFINVNPQSSTCVTANSSQEIQNEPPLVEKPPEHDCVTEQNQIQSEPHDPQTPEMHAGVKQPRITGAQNGNDKNDTRTTVVAVESICKQSSDMETTTETATETATSTSCTSEESVAVTVIPAKFRNAREFSRKEEFLQRGSNSTVRSRNASEQTQGARHVIQPDTGASDSVTTFESSSSLSYDEAVELAGGQVHLIDRLTKLYNDLKTLWLDVNEMARVPYVQQLERNDEQAFMLVNLCAFIVKEMQKDWKNAVSSAVDKDRLAKLEETNRLLQEQVESSRAMQSCLQTEVKFMTKDKANMNEELKALSMRLANLQVAQENKAMRKCSSSSLGFDVSRSASAETISQSSHMEKRAADFNSLMDVIKSRSVDVNFYQNQFEQYHKQIKELETEINEVSSEKAQLEDKYAKLAQDHEALQKEAASQESVLRFVLKEKNSAGSCDGLIESLFEKINSIESKAVAKDFGESDAFRLHVARLEAALQTAEEEKQSLRKEVSQLKSALTGLAEKKSDDSSDLESKCLESQRMIHNLTKRLNDKLDEADRAEEDYARKGRQWQDHCKAIEREKENLERLVEEKEFELKNQMEMLQGYEKRNLRQEKRVQDMHKSNGRLKREIQELKQNIEQLSTIVHQLRSSLREQKVQWTERVKAVTNDAVQAKEHCRWLQSQVEHLNSQVVENQERVKAHEKDKCNLALQILAIDEERKMVDEKLRELRAALQGDSVRRENLIERNEALQSEIHRLRRGKLASLAKPPDAWDENANDFEPPSEMKNVERILPSYPGSVNASVAEKGPNKKNCYTASAAIASSRRGAAGSAAQLTTPGAT